VATQKVRIVFQPSGRQGEIEKRKTLLDASQEIGVDIKSLCGGKQLCGKCKVKIEEGRFEKLGEKPNAVLEELKSWGAIGGCNSEGTYWIWKYLKRMHST